MSTASRRATGTILDRIVAAKSKAVERQKAKAPLAQVRARAEAAGSTTGFAEALAGPGISLIAEMKRASPSGGELRPDLDPSAMARTYAEAGAAAISVLTEADHFRGDIADLRAARSAAAPHGVAILQKDFVFDEYQVYEARAGGADAVLLIVSILDHDRLAALLSLTTDLGMDALVEAFDEAELDAAIDAGAAVVGINNRNLKTLETSLTVFERLAPRAPEGTILVAESGMKAPQDVRRMTSAGADAVLVGEALMRAGGGVAELARQLAAEGR